MDLTQLANLGEFIGGVAVLVTLVYLAVQMRHSNQIATTDVVHKNINTLSTYRQILADDSVRDVPEPAEAQDLDDLFAAGKDEKSAQLTL